MSDFKRAFPNDSTLQASRQASEGPNQWPWNSHQACKQPDQWCRFCVPAVMFPNMLEILCRVFHTTLQMQQCQTSMFSQQDPSQGSVYQEYWIPLLLRLCDSCSLVPLLDYNETRKDLTLIKEAPPTRPRGSSIIQCPTCSCSVAGSTWNCSRNSTPVSSRKAPRRRTRVPGVRRAPVNFSRKSWAKRMWSGSGANVGDAGWGLRWRMCGREVWWKWNGLV